MMTLGLQRRVLLLLCVASVLLSGCVSKGKYNDLEGKYNGLQGQYNQLQGQYTDLQGQYKQLQQSSAAQAAQSSAEIAALKKEAAADKVQVSRLQDAIKYTVNSDLLFRSGSWEMSPQGQELIAKLAPKLAPFQQYEDRGERLYRQRPSRAGAAAAGHHLERGAVAKACRSGDAVSDLARREAGHDLGAGVRRGGAHRLEQHRQGARAESPRRGDPGRANLAITLRYL